MAPEYETNPYMDPSRNPAGEAHGPSAYNDSYYQQQAQQAAYNAAQGAVPNPQPTQQNPYYSNQQQYYQQPAYAQQSYQQPPQYAPMPQQTTASSTDVLTGGMKFLWIVIGFFIPIIGIWILGFGYKDSTWAKLHESVKWLGIGAIINIAVGVIFMFLYIGVIMAIIGGLATTGSYYYY